MGRKVRRVPLDFDWPIGEVWHGFLSPERLHGQRCAVCDGTGYSPDARRLQDRWYGYVPFDPAETGSAPLAADTPAVRAFAERNVSHGTGEDAIVREARQLADMWNNQWSHHLGQADVDALVAAGRLYDLTHTWVRGEGWTPIEPAPQVTAEQVNTWSLRGMGHDSINCWVVVRAACERLGVEETCSYCGGHGSIEKYEGQRAEAEAWEPTDLPVGDGWQPWETVSEGSPKSPVFPSADDLAAWMADPDRDEDWMPAGSAAKFIAEGWAPTFVGSAETGVVSGAEFVGFHVERGAGG
jgi:hypothetical protein